MRPVRTLQYLILFTALILSVFLYEPPENHVSKPSTDSTVTLAWVLKVIDGDSFIVRRDGESTTESIRLYGVDAPEHTQTFGKKAKEILYGLTKGRALTITAIEKDPYGRTVALVSFKDGTLLQHSLLDRGAVWNYRHYSQRSDFMQRETEARRKHLGLWRENSPMPPWVFRKQHRKRR